MSALLHNPLQKKKFNSGLIRQQNSAKLDDFCSSFEEPLVVHEIPFAIRHNKKKSICKVLLEQLKLIYLKWWQLCLDYYFMYEVERDWLIEHVLLQF